MGGVRKPFNEYKILNNGEAEFYITNRNKENFIVKLDKEDLERLIKLNRPWNASWRNDSQSYYATCCEYLGIINGKPKYKTHYLHRWIFDYPEDTVIDHKNHDTLDDRKHNLRLTVQNKNLKHRNGKNKNNKSGYRNVCWIEEDQRWFVQLQVNGKNTVLGRFKIDELEEAGKFAEEMREKYYGKFKGVS